MRPIRRTAPGWEPEAGQGSGGQPESTHHGNTRHRQHHDLAEQIEDVIAGRYRPRPGTVGAKLLGAHADACGWHAKRSIGLFAKVAERYEGLWWVTTLNADADGLDSADAEYVARMWRIWLAGSNPFTRSGHVRA